MVQEPKKKAAKEKDAKKEKKKPAEAAAPAPANKETELSVSLLNIQVGLIRKAWKHPSADRFVIKTLQSCGSVGSLLIC